MHSRGIFDLVWMVQLGRLLHRARGLTEFLEAHLWRSKRQMTTQLNLLQGFTSDMAVLKNALDPKKGGAPQVSQLLDNPISSLDALVNSGATSTDITQQMVDAVTRFEAMQSSFQTAMRVQYTLDGFDSLARYLMGIPGRKNVIWFSGSFPLDIEPNPSEEDPNDSVERFDEWVRETDNLLTRAQVAVYPVDERGLQTDPSQNFYDESGNAPNPFAPVSAQAAATKAAAFLQQTAAEHLTMLAMAEDTGGQAFINTNGLTQAVQNAIENGSNYYSLTYAPTNPAWDSRFRAIKVKVDQPGVKLTYRNGPAVSVPVDTPSSAPPAVEPTAPPALQRRTAPSTNPGDSTVPPN